MQYIEAPNNTEPKYTSLFLGGGITDCPDWQAYFISMLPPDINLTVYNPRRKNFNIKNPKESEIQIEWEYQYLRRAGILLFWFPRETLCPITLFELGSALERCYTSPKALIVGCHPEYARRFDVKKQIKLRGYGGEIRSNIEELVDDVLKIL